jgi:hypothetical protein
MGAGLRKTGIELLGYVSRGTHLCHFYQTKEDLIDILVPYFRAGPEGNGFCVRVFSPPLLAKRANNKTLLTGRDFNKAVRGQNSGL